MGKRSLHGVLALVAISGIVAFMCASPIPITQKKAEKRVLHDFNTNREEFVKVVNDVSLNTMPLATVLGIRPIKEFSIPHNLADIGINSIYSADGILFSNIKIS